MTGTFQQRSRLSAGSVALASWLALGGCAAPTEIKVNIYTNLPCGSDADWQGIALYVGALDQNIENRAPALAATTCDRNGQIGSLVIVPSGANDAEVAVRVVAGITQNPEDCATHQYEGCIVARRELRFRPHATLDLDITLSSDCRGVGCDAAHTCVAGKCADTTSLPGVNPASDSPDASSAGVVRCGDNGLFCPTSGDVCCLTVDTSAGTTSRQCLASELCPPTSIVLQCDDESDCTALTDDQGRIGMCDVGYYFDQNQYWSPQKISGSQCMVHAGTHGRGPLGLELCESRLPCLGGITSCLPSESTSTLLPGYYWCGYDINDEGDGGS